jgi:quinol monooxygenase YgiN
MLTMTVIAQVKPEKQQEFRHAIGSLYSTREEEEKGLKKSTLYQEVDDPRGFRLITEWETQKDLEGYLQAEKFRVLLGALEVLCAKSEIRYSHLVEKGAEVLKSKP